MNRNENAEELKKFLAINTEDVVENIIQFNEIMSRYEAAIKEIETKLEILSKDFSIRNHRNPIEDIRSRVKKPASIISKLSRNGMELSFDAITKELNDIAGIRVICAFIDDIYVLADMLIKQDDITLINVKDYIKNPKENGYRSYHMIIEIPVFFMDEKQPMRVEIQIRTVAMDFWASLEHELKYKKDIDDAESIGQELKDCAQTIAETDEKMLNLRKRIEASR